MGRKQKLPINWCRISSINSTLVETRKLRTPLDRSPQFELVSGLVPALWSPKAEGNDVVNTVNAGEHRANICPLWMFPKMVITPKYLFSKESEANPFIFVGIPPFSGNLETPALIPAATKCRMKVIKLDHEDFRKMVIIRFWTQRLVWLQKSCFPGQMSRFLKGFWCTLVTVVSSSLHT